MGRNIEKTFLTYSASRDDPIASEFHNLTDWKPQTVSLFKIKENGQCIGGFTSAYWKSP